MKLAPKLTILFFLLSILPTAIVGYLAYENGRRTIVQETIDHLVSINIFKNNELKRWVKGDESSIQELAQRHLVRQYAALLAKHDTPDHAYQNAKASIIEDHLKPRLKYGGFFELFLMCPRHGLISASTDEKQEGKYRDTYPYFIEGKSRTHIQGIYYSPVLEQLAMTISTPIKDKQGNLTGVLGGRLDLGELSKIIALQSGKSPTEDTYLVNTFNFFVTEPRFGQGYALKKAVRTEGVEAGLSGKDGVGFYKDYRGVPVIGAYKWLPEFKMCIITEIDQAEAFAPIVHLAWVIAAIASAISIAAGLFGLFFARTIIRPVRKLVAGADEIGGGNLEHRVGTASKDEIGGLSRTFDRMAAALSDKETQLREYTTQLETSNKELETEIAERKRTEETLRQSEEKYRTLVTNIPDITWTTDSEGNTTFISPSVVNVYGYTSEDIYADHELWLGRIHPDDIDRVMKTFQALFTENKKFDIEYRVQRKDGVWVWLHDRSMNTYENEGKRYADGVFSDITERKRAEEEINKLNEELKRNIVQLEVANKELEAFSYSVSHDLRAPLRAIDGFSRVVLEDYTGKLDDEGKRYLNIIRSNTQKMGQLIDDLLLFSRLGRQELRASGIDMGKLAKAVSEELKLAVPERKLKFTINTLIPAQGDQAMIRQVLVNLLSNAVKFTRPKENATIEIGGGREGNENIYYVKDNGVGFDMQYVDKLFGVFQRLHSAAEFEGTGVGLAIVQRIIHRHGGRVWAEGKVGDGASFYFSLPAK